MRSHSSLILTISLSLVGAFGQTATPSTQTASAQTTQTVAAVVPFGEIKGAVKSGAIPLPGVAITAANTLTGKKYITSSDVDGSFKINVTGKGRYVVRAEFAAFAPVTQEVLINEQNRNGSADLSMILLSRAQEKAQQEQKLAQQAAGGRGMQQLSLAGGDLGGATPAGSDATPAASAALPNSGLAAEGSNESVAVSGAMGRTDQPTFDPGEMQDRLADMRDQLARQGGGSGTVNMGGGMIGNIQMMGGGGGGFGGGGGQTMIIMGGPGGGGGRGMRGFNVNKPHGSLFYTYGGSPLDAKPYSLTGQPETKASYDQQRFGLSIGGPLNIPHIYQGGMKTFVFGTYFGNRGSNPYDVFSTVPTLAQRNGDFSGAGVQLFNPITHAPLTNNQITNINPTAAGLLNFFPQPNIPNVPANSRNFHFVSSNGSHSDILFFRFNHSFGNSPGGMMGMFGLTPEGQGRRGGGRQNANKNATPADKKKAGAKWSHSINGGLNLNSIRNDILNPFPGLGGQLQVHNYNVNFGYNLSKGVFINSLRFNYNRSNTQSHNGFTDRNNIAAALGINGVSQSPADFGLPGINLAPEFSGLNDLSPTARTDQNYTVGDTMTWSKGKHGWTWGGDFRHQLLDMRNAPNARGSFVFNGQATGGIGSDGQFHPGLPLGDFLFGFPRQTSIQFGAGMYQFRANAFNLFVQDNWRVGKNLTLNLGLRYEYISPFTELDNKLVNLDIAPGFTAVAPVTAGQSGPFTGPFPKGLIDPDRNNFAPRIGIAWKPFSKTVVRAGYGVNYNLGQYALMATQLGFQPPFAVTQTNFGATPTSLTLQNGFPPSNTPVTNSYAVDRNYKLGYVQSWNLNIQQDMKHDLIVNLNYTGSKGTRLDMVRAPSLDANGVPLNTSQAFLFESSSGFSILHSASLRVRKRMRHGFSAGGTYTFSKSIDNASSIGGGATVVAQNDQNLSAERGLSSFDQRHRFTSDFYYDLPFGKDKKWFKGDTWAAKMFGGFNMTGNLSIASGFPFSPRIFGNSTDLQRGVTGAHRPDVVAGQPITGPQTLHQWFNTAAFTNPAGTFGDAGRNIIIGPGSLNLDMSFGKTITVKEAQNLELRFSANNILNHARFTGIDTTVGSPTFGQVVTVASMRKAQLTARYRF